jgi:hypothetical protein
VRVTWPGVVAAWLGAVAVAHAAPPGGDPGCPAQLGRVQADVERTPSRQRLPAVLAGLGRACPAQLGDLGRAARRAAGQKQGVRPVTLAAAALPLVEAGCRVEDARAPAASVVASCPVPAGWELDPGLLGDLDAGTYVFARAVWARLEGHGVLDAPARRVLDTLVLAGAVEGERRRAAAAVKPAQGTGKREPPRPPR